MSSAVRRTAERRPDLVHPSTVLNSFEARAAEGAGELFTLQLACWVQEARDNPDVEIPALAETLDDVREWLGAGTVVVVPAQAGSSARSADGCGTRRGTSAG